VDGGVICSGAIVVDVLVRPVERPEWGTTTFVETIETHPGGNGANTAVALARVGTPVRLLGAVGRDANGRYLLDALAQAGVDTSLVSLADDPTGATIVLVNGAGERKFLHAVGAGAEAFAEGIDFGPAATEGMSHYHLASPFILPKLRPRMAEVLAAARAAGLTTSLDTNWDPLGLWMETIGPCLPHLDFLFMNEDEARMLPGAAARTTVLKRGARGCAIYAGGREILCPAFDVPVVDTTGAGDCFAAGYLAAMLRGDGPEECGRFANAVAAQTVQRVGAAAAVPCREEIERWMATAAVRG
jgi:sugar/nucleoside kinase (ribokinase family)